MTKKTLEKTFYLIAKYWLGRLEGFIRIGDDKEEITKLFEEKYMWKENTLGITEESYQLLEVNAKELMNDNALLKKEEQREPTITLYSAHESITGKLKKEDK